MQDHDANMTKDFKDVPISQRRYQTESFLNRTFDSYNSKKVGHILTRNGFWSVNIIRMSSFIIANMFTIPSIYFILSFMPMATFYIPNIILYIAITFCVTMFLFITISDSHIATYRVKNASKWD